MHLWLCLAAFLTICSACVDFNENPQCHSNYGNSFVRNFIPVSRRFNTMTTFTEYQKYYSFRHNFKIQKCKPIMFYLVSRHSIRYPDAESIDKLNSVLPELQAEMNATRSSLLCEKDFEAILNWTPRMKTEDDNNVPEAGVNETMSLARKYRKLFPNLLDHRRSNITVGITSKVRTNQTADAFIRGVQMYTGCDEDENDENDFDDEETYTWDPPKEQKDFLEFHVQCKNKIREKNGKLPKPKALKKIKNSELATKLSESVRKRLGLRRQVDFKLIELLRTACAFEYAVYKDAPWCSALSNTDLQILEYIQDLDDYLSDAYGSTFYSSSCLLFEDLLQKMNASVNENRKRKAYLYFSHAGALKRIWSSLGLFFDQRMLLNSDPQTAFCERRNRFWRSSLNTPFGAHFLVVLYKCKHGNGEEPTYKVLTSVNTAPITVKGCDGPLCDLSQFQKEYEPFVNDCDLDTLCV